MEQHHCTACCNRHRTDRCPFYDAHRISHADAYCDDRAGRTDVVRVTATEIPMFHDGNYLTRSVEHADPSSTLPLHTRAEMLRTETQEFIRQFPNAKHPVSQETFAEMVWNDARKSVGQCECMWCDIVVVGQLHK